MQRKQKGTLLFTAATTSFRAKPPLTGFAMAKAGLRAAQRIAREFGPLDIYTVHPILDAVIDGARARPHFSDYISQKDTNGFVQFDEVAQNY